MGGVRCLGLFPKKNRFFLVPSLSKISVCSDKCFWMWNEEKGTFYWSPTFYLQVKYRLQGTFYCPKNGKKTTSYWSPTFYLQIKSRTPVKSPLLLISHPEALVTANWYFTKISMPLIGSFLLPGNISGTVQKTFMDLLGLGLEIGMASLLTIWQIGTYFLQEVHTITWSA